MVEEEILLVRIKFIIDMCSSGIISTGSALSQILKLIVNHDMEEQE